MIGPDGSIEGDFVIGPHGREHIRVPFVVERLLEFIRVPSEVPEVGEEDFALVPEVVDGLGNVHPHLGEASLTERDAVTLSRSDLKGPVEGFHAGEYPGDAEHRREGRIVGMQRQADPGFLRHRKHPFYKVCVVFPHLLLRERPEFGGPGVPDRVVLEAGDPGAASAECAGGRSHPSQSGHKIVAHDPDARLSQIAQGLTEMVYFFVASGKAELGLFHRGRTLHHRQIEARIRHFVFEAQEGQEFPNGLFLAGGHAPHDIGHSDLFRESQGRVRKGIED